MRMCLFIFYVLPNNAVHSPMVDPKGENTDAAELFLSSVVYNCG